MPKAPSIELSPISPEHGDDDAALPEIVAKEEPVKPAVSKFGDEPGFILTPPVEYQGRTVEFISIDLSKLRGDQIDAVEREFKARYKPDPDESCFMNNHYLLLLFARINDLDEGFFARLNGVVYLQLTEFYKIRMKQVLGK